MLCFCLWEIKWYDICARGACFSRLPVSSMSDRVGEGGAVIQAGRVETSRPGLDMMMLAVCRSPARLVSDMMGT